ncbi:MAG: EboA domain-containing protein [Ilyomonas sp.]
MEDIISEILKKNIAEDAYNWLQKQASFIREEENAQRLNLTFAAVPRKTGKNKIDASGFVLNDASVASVNDWTADRLARVWLLMQVNDSDKTHYLKKIKTLFISAEMNELVALYSALPVFAYAEEWVLQCAEGIRSNIGLVLEAIMYDNPYPAKYLDESAWNQLVMKAFFTDKDVNRIIGLEERANKKLADTLIDYAHERWAAYRNVNPHLWHLVSRFLDADNFNDVKKVFESANLTERKAAALALYKTGYQAAEDLLNTVPELKKAIELNELNWRTLDN